MVFALVGLVVATGVAAFGLDSWMHVSLGSQWALVFILASGGVGGTLGTLFAYLVRKHEEARAGMLALPPTETYVAAYISGVATVCTVSWFALFTAVLFALPKSVGAPMIHWVATHLSTPALPLCITVVYIFSVQLGVWYAARVKHLRTTHSSVKITLMVVFLLLVTLNWQQNLVTVWHQPATFAWAVGVLAVIILVVHFSLRRAQERLVRAQ